MTPIRRQYLRIKRKYPDALLFFRLGDFYETFDDDAHLASRELEIVLTSRSMGKGLRVPMAGIPAHSLDSYLARLIKRGYKVAICEQLTDPAKSKGLVERDVVRVVTPGTVVEPTLLEQKANNYLAALVVEGEAAGLAHVDITTGEFATTQMSVEELSLEVERLSPAEVIVPQGRDVPGLESNGSLTPVPPSSFDSQVARRTLLDHFGVLSLGAFGCELPLAMGAAGAIVEYLSQTQRVAQTQLATLVTYSTGSFMTLDRQTRRNLELFEGGRWGEERLSLYAILDLTRTSMGARLLRRWLGQPLLDLAELERRLEAVRLFYVGLARREKTRTLLSRVIDVERVLNRVRLGSVLPRELVGLKASLEASAELATLLKDKGPSGGPVEWLTSRMHPCPEVVTLIDSALPADPIGVPGDGNVIRQGFSKELDEVRSAGQDARQYIAGIEKAERGRTGIRSLKIGYNRVFGYYIEVSNSHRDQAPEHYIRRQTLVGAERYITPELKEYESLVLGGQERTQELEKEIYRQVCAQVGEAGHAISSLADAIAHLDVFSTLAEAAVQYGYVKPDLIENASTLIKGGRHPIVERVMPPGTFVPNDTNLSTEEERLVVLTGPNMAGKSTYIRQVALITLMAQIGSFVPADSATLGIVDRIFTRAGLQDDLATGQSTFMVEMVETAAILNQASPRSLVVLDEIGRGTSTYDGLSIARSVVEYLHNHPRLGCRTLFATHYHELAELANTLPGVRNYTVAVSEEAERVVFHHRIVAGSADRSYGVQVAQLAGLPPAVTNRAWEVLLELERGDHSAQQGRRRRGKGQGESAQLPLLASPSLLADELLRLDVSNMTPLEALNKLYELQRQVQDSQGQ